MIVAAIGYDPRESISYHVLEQSIIDKTSQPVCIIPLASRLLNNFDGQRDGTNAFIYSRFLVPELMDYQGWAVYMDSDMLLRADLAELWALRDESKAVMVVKHDYHTKHRRKLIGTPMECDNSDYPRKNWSSLILWNCGHPRNRIITTEYASEAPGSNLHRFQWLGDDLIGELPAAWNHLVGEYPLTEDANLVHFTAGAPCFSHYRKCDYASEWHGKREDVNAALDKSQLMGVA
jgi:lipopolysaccharide biosynthesis glycosyltransferase